MADNEYHREVVLSQIFNVIQWLNNKADEAGSGTTQVSGLDCKVAADMVAGLLAEVERQQSALERLRAENAAMRPIVAAVADIENSDGSACYVTCELTLFDSDTPDEGIHHDSPCIIEQARAFLTSEQAAERKGE